MSSTYIIIQVIGFIGTAFYFLSYQCKSNKNLFRVQFVSYMLYTIHLFLLGAVTGALSYILNLVRSLFLGSNNKKLHSRGACVIICLLQVVVAVFTWSGWISLLPIVANIVIHDWRLYPQRQEGQTGGHAGQLTSVDYLRYHDWLLGRYC